MVQHEGLDGHGAPGIEYSEAPLGLVPLQDHLGREQAIHDPLA
jgi:hypothetical protein